MERLVRSSAVASEHEAEFVRRLRRSGLLVNARFADGARSVVTGHSVAERHPKGMRPIWFGGGKPAKDLTLPALRTSWPDTPQQALEAAEEWWAAKRHHRIANPDAPDMKQGPAVTSTAGRAFDEDLARKFAVQLAEARQASNDHSLWPGQRQRVLFLAEKAGLNVARTRVESVLGRGVLLVERFDRTNDGGRILATSALTLTGLDELQARGGSFVEFLDALRSNGPPEGTASELFARIAFSMSISNSDDHLRNHAALWDGSVAILSPAYDLSPMRRSGETASQAIAYDRNGTRRTNLSDLIAARSLYDLT